MQKLVTNITYLPFGGKTLYLSSILDLYNGEVVAYSIADKQDTSFVLDTLNQFPVGSDMMLHSDQGSVYTSQVYQEAIKAKGITMSLSRKNPTLINVVAKLEYMYVSKNPLMYVDPSGNFQALAGCSMLCFSASTKIKTTEGYEAIEDIQVGDIVQTKDEETGEVGYPPEEELIQRVTDEIYPVTM